MRGSALSYSPLWILEADVKMEKIKYFVGLDVHKRFTHYIMRDKEGQVILDGRCASTGKDVYSIIEPYLGSCSIGAESNVEVFPLYEYFSEKGKTIKIGNTIQLRTLIGKNDRLDAMRLSDMLRLNSFPCAFLPQGKLKQIRGIVKVRHTIRVESSRLQVQIQSAMRKHGLVIPGSGSFTQKWHAKLEDSLQNNHELVELKHLLELYTCVNMQLDKITKEMVNFANLNFNKQFTTLCQMKGIGPVLATYFISEIGPIKRFSSIKKLRRYAGVIPCSQQSADKTYGTCLPKTSSRALLRWALVQAAHCMIKFNHNLRQYYLIKKKQKKIPQKAIMAVARSVCDMIYKNLNHAA